MTERVLLLVLLIAAVLGNAKPVAIGICVLLVLQLSGLTNDGLTKISPLISTVGLALVIAATMVPLITKGMTVGQLFRDTTTVLGFLAFGLSMFTTYLSGKGLSFLGNSDNSVLFIPLFLGAITSAILFKGMPVGPFITAGMISLIATVAKSLSR